MIYSENLTNRELLANAMPLETLSRKQWNALLRYMEKVESSEKDSDLYGCLKILISNQSRIEIISDFKDMYDDKLSDAVREENTLCFNL